MNNLYKVTLYVEGKINTKGIVGDYFGSVTEYPIDKETEKSFLTHSDYSNKRVSKDNLDKLEVATNTSHCIGFVSWHYGTMETVRELQKEMKIKIGAILDDRLDSVITMRSLYQADKPNIQHKAIKDDVYYDSKTIEKALEE